MFSIELVLSLYIYQCDAVSYLFGFRVCIYVQIVGEMVLVAPGMNYFEVRVILCFWELTGDLCSYRDKQHGIVNVLEHANALHLRPKKYNFVIPNILYKEKK